MSQPLSSSFAATDVASLSRLKAEARRDPKAVLRQVAQQFEALMMNQMLKSMRETVSDDGVFGSQEGKTFQGMLDQQWVTQMSESKGLGIADMLVRQLGRNLPGQDGMPSAVMLQDAPRQLLPPALHTGSARQYLPPATNEVAASSRPQDSVQPLKGERGEFVSRLLPYARRAAERLGVDPELIVAHAALETGWGRQTPAASQGSPSHNLFGIKAGSQWRGAVAEASTTEFENGVPQRRTERFRAYQDFAQAFDDYADLLSRARFAGVRNTGADSAAFAQGLQAGGYATDPHYARKLQQVALQLQGRV